MTEIADPVKPGDARTPMLLGRFRTWLAMVAFVTLVDALLGGGLADRFGRTRTLGIAVDLA